MRQLAAMDIQVWKRREKRWSCLKLVACHELYIICSHTYQAAVHRSLWAAIVQAMSRWQATTLEMTTLDLQTLSSDSVILYLTDEPNDLDTSADICVMPSLQSMLDDTSQKAILWNAVKDSMSKT